MSWEEELYGNPKCKSGVGRKSAIRQRENGPGERRLRGSILIFVALRRRARNESRRADRRSPCRMFFDGSGRHSGKLGLRTEERQNDGKSSSDQKRGRVRHPLYRSGN